MYFKRGPNKVHNPYTYKDMYNFYINEIVKSSIYKVSVQTYRKIIEMFFKMVSEEIFDGQIFYIPYGLGKYSVVKKKINVNVESTIPIDWELTVKLGKKIYNFNEHSKGFKYRYYWDRNFVTLKNKSLYRLIPTRYNKRHLAFLIKSGEKDYIEFK